MGEPGDAGGPAWHHALGCAVAGGKPAIPVDRVEIVDELARKICKDLDIEFVR